MNISKKWSAFREKYRKLKKTPIVKKPKKQPKPSGSGAGEDYQTPDSSPVMLKQWHLYTLMHFLDPVLKERRYAKYEIV
jgi:hypothetical protein